MVRKILHLGDEALRKVCKPIPKFDLRLWLLLRDMADTMNKAEGVGLAAPQVGICRRIFIMHLGENDIVEAINPEVINKEGKQRVQEGCLSCPNIWGYVTRPMSCRLKAQDRNGNWFEIEGQELLAQAICHELEHLDGHLFIDIVEEWVDPDDLEDEQENQ